LNSPTIEAGFAFGLQLLYASGKVIDLATDYRNAPWTRSSCAAT